MGEIMMLVDNRGFLTLDPRVQNSVVALAVSIGIYAIAIPPNSCDDRSLLQNIRVIDNGDHISGRIVEVTYADLSSRNRRRQHQPEKGCVPFKVAKVLKE
jgi:hypothetical protein